jgi:hypothetical protein
MPCNIKACPYEKSEDQALRFAEEMKVLPAGKGDIYYDG